MQAYAGVVGLILVSRASCIFPMCRGKRGRGRESNFSLHLPRFPLRTGKIGLACVARLIPCGRGK